MSRVFSDAQVAEKDQIAGMVRMGPYLGSQVKNSYLCSFCHKEFLVKPNDVWSAGVRGHLPCSRAANSGDQHHKFSGFKEITGTFWKNLKTNARVRGLSVDITKEEAYAKLVEQQHRCYYSGLSISLDVKSEVSASIDRLDSNLGYTLQNIVWCHKTVNKMKMELGVEEFLRFCKLITEHNMVKAICLTTTS